MRSSIVVYCLYSKSNNLCSSGSEQVKFDWLVSNSLNLASLDKVIIEYADDAPVHYFNIMDRVSIQQTDFSLTIRGLGKQKYAGVFISPTKYSKFSALNLTNIELSDFSMKYTTDLIHFNHAKILNSTEISSQDISSDFYSLQYATNLRFGSIIVPFAANTDINVKINLYPEKFYPNMIIKLKEINDDYDTEFVGHLINFKIPSKNFTLSIYPPHDDITLDISSTKSLKATYSNKLLSNTVKSYKILITNPHPMILSYLPSFWSKESHVKIFFNSMPRLEIHNYCSYIPILINSNHSTNTIVDFYQHTKSVTIDDLFLYNTEFIIHKAHEKAEKMILINLDVMNSTIYNREDNFELHVDGLVFPPAQFSSIFNATGKIFLYGTISMNYGSFNFENVFLMENSVLSFLYNHEVSGILNCKKLNFGGSTKSRYVISIIEKTDTLSLDNIVPIVCENNFDSDKFDLEFLSQENYLLFTQNVVKDANSLYNLVIQKNNSKIGNLCLIDPETGFPEQCPSTTTCIVRHNTFDYDMAVRSFYYMSDKLNFDYSHIQLLNYLTISSSIYTPITFPFNSFQNVKFENINLSFHAEKLEFGSATFHNTEISGVKYIKGQKAKIEYNTFECFDTIDVINLTIMNGAPRRIVFYDDLIKFDEKIIQIHEESNIIWNTTDEINTDIEINGTSFEKFTFITPVLLHNNLYIKNNANVQSSLFQFSGTVYTNDTYLPIRFESVNLYFILPTGTNLVVNDLKVSQKVAVMNSAAAIYTKNLNLLKIGNVVSKHGTISTDCLTIDTDGLTNEIGSITVKKSMKVTSKSLANMDFSKSADNIVIDLDFTLASVPFMLSKSKNPENVTFNMRNVGEGEELQYNSQWDGIQVDIICGQDLNCSKWTANWESSIWAFNGTDRLFDMKCGAGLFNRSEKCYSIVKREQDPNSPTEKSKTRRILIICFSVVAVFILVIFVSVYLIIMKIRHKRLNNFLASSDNIYASMVEIE